MCHVGELITEQEHLIKGRIRVFVCPCLIQLLVVHDEKRIRIGNQFVREINGADRGDKTARLDPFPLDERIIGVTAGRGGNGNRDNICILTAFLDGIANDVILDVRANAKLALLTKQITQKEGINELLKAQDQMAWVKAMTNEQKKLFSRYTDAVHEHQMTTDCLIFQNGFNLGARIMLEAMEE